MASNDYQGFIVGNRAKINRYLNRALWVFIITGPAIALGVAAGIFSHTDYGTCLGITLFVTALAAVHLATVKLRPHSVLTSVVAIVAIEAIVVYMELSHVNIQLTWFLAPLLSILFCDRRLFFFALITNYLAMVGATWVTAPYYIAIGSPFDDPSHKAERHRSSFHIGKGIRRKKVVCNGIYHERNSSIHL